MKSKAWLVAPLAVLLVLAPGSPPSPAQETPRPGGGLKAAMIGAVRTEVKGCRFTPEVCFSNAWLAR
jgi:hypothetical protein